jgi:hypothetical protein
MSIHTVKNLGKSDIVLKLDKRSFCPPGFLWSSFKTCSGLG